MQLCMFANWVCLMFGKTSMDIYAIMFGCMFGKTSIDIYAIMFGCMFGKTSIDIYVIIVLSVLLICVMCCV